MNRVRAAMLANPAFLDAHEDLKSIPKATGKLKTGPGGRSSKCVYSNAFI